MHRRQRLKFLATKSGMRAAARLQKRRRGGLNEHRYVVGQFNLVNGRVVLACVEMGPAFDVPRPPRLTYDSHRFCRWRTRQAAQQFAVRWELAGECHVMNLHWMDVLRPSLQVVNGSTVAGSLSA